MSNIKQYEYLIRIQNGDMYACDEFLKLNEGLIYGIIKRYQNYKLTKEELYQIASVGFMKAVKQFDITSNYAFSTYAIPMIIGEIKQYFRQNQDIHVSRNMRKLYYDIVKAQNELNQLLFKEATYEEIANYLQVELQDVIIALEVNQSLLSSDYPYKQSDGTTLILADYLSKKEQDIVLKLSLNGEIKQLEPQLRMIIIYRYYHNLTQQQIAKLCGISQVQVSRLEYKAIAILKTKLK